MLQEENNIVHSQKVDILQKMLTKEQQDLQASDVIAVICQPSSFSVDP